MKTKLTLILSVILLLCITITACGAGNAEFESSEGLGNGDYGYSDSNSGTKDPSKDPSAEYAEKIIKEVSMYAQTKEFDNAIDKIRDAVKTYGGYEENFSTNGQSIYHNGQYSRSARAVFRIPSENLDAFLGEIGTLINVTSQSSSTKNVTAEYYDIQSRIGVLEAEKAAYEEMLTKAENVTNALAIKDRLYDVIEEIEAYRTQLKIYDNKVAYSTVTMSLEEVVEYTNVEEEGFWTRMGNAFIESWSGFYVGLQNFLVGFVYAFPTLLVLVSIPVALIFIITFINRRAKKRAAERTAKKLAEMKNNPPKE